MNQLLQTLKRNVEVRSVRATLKTALFPPWTKISEFSSSPNCGGMAHNKHLLKQTNLLRINSDYKLASVVETLENTDIKMKCKLYTDDDSQNSDVFES